MREHINRDGKFQSSMWQDELDLELEVTAPRLAIGTRQVEKVAVGDDDELRAEALAQIVHDLKSPLSTIGLETCLLEERMRGDRESCAALARVQRNLAFLDRMVHDILDSLAIEAGELDLKRTSAELRALLQRVIERVVPTRDRTRVYLDARNPAMVSIDDLRIERVVANLLTNALKYAPPASEVVVRLEMRSSGVRVSVIDAGTSMTPSDLLVVFDRFRRVGSSASHEGSGLGLYVSRRIVEAHGGHIDVECARGIGTRFFFDLPW
jgi:signal transduction histidine kinase